MIINKAGYRDIHFSMTFSIPATEYFLLGNKNCQTQKYNLLLDDDEIFIEQVASLGQHGYMRSLELSPGVHLEIWNFRCDRDLILKCSGGDRTSIEMIMLNSGCFPDNDIYPTIGGKQSFIGGSGAIPANPLQFSNGQHLTGAIVNFKPEVFTGFFPHLDLNSAFGKQIIKGDDWAESFFPKVTPSIYATVRQIINTPYQGAIRKLYLQAKVMELLAIQLDQIMTEFNCLPVISSLKSQNIERIYQARDILENQLENPPSIAELSRQIGVSDFTLRRGFQEIFGTTVIGYLTQKRLEQAELLLREKKHSVAEVANLVGYAHLGYFAKVFKRRFGLTPSECLAGKVFRE
ncbi:MAG: AraC family transcriptional regulator [Cyanobacteria bacterium P01_G01_bin.67]